MPDENSDFDLSAFLSNVEKASKRDRAASPVALAQATPVPVGKPSTAESGSPFPDDEAPDPSPPSPAEWEQAKREIVVDSNGHPRQAGAAPAPNSPILDQIRGRCERSLFIFAKLVLGLDRLTPTLHREVCRFLQDGSRKKRKLVLLPRDHLKTSIVSRSLPIHMLIQPAKNGAYFADKAGPNTRILLAGETATNTEHQLSWIAGTFESNLLLRAFWPDCCWQNPRREAKRWNAQVMVIPRTQDFPEASIETMGVGGAVTGRHYDVLLKDDLVTLEAANSPTVMFKAIEWHKTSRALLDDPDLSLEFIIGTRWAVMDLYEDIERNDPSVEVYKRAAIEDGKPIFGRVEPESGEPFGFTLDSLAQLSRELGVLFPLLYMNNAVDPALTDFDPGAIRYFEVSNGKIRFDESELDEIIREKVNAPAPTVVAPAYGAAFNEATYDAVVGNRESYLRFKYG